jgi:opacity protein-like surface antigen
VTVNASKPFGPPTAPVQLIDDDVYGFAWQMMAGLAVPISGSLALTAQYRYFDAGTIHGHDTRGQPFTIGINGNNIDVGVRYVF